MILISTSILNRSSKGSSPLISNFFQELNILFVSPKVYLYNILFLVDVISLLSTNQDNPPPTFIDRDLT